MCQGVNANIKGHLANCCQSSQIRSKHDLYSAANRNDMVNVADDVISKGEFTDLVQ